MFSVKIKLLLTLVLLCELTQAGKYPCTVKSTSLLLKRHVYNFSMEILRRVSQDTNGHFVFSPLSTWLQLGTLAEGAKGRTLREIRKVTRHTAHGCFKRQLSNLLRKMNRDLVSEYRRKSMLIADELMGVKKPYVNKIRRLYGTKLFLENYDNPKKSAAELNQILESRSNGVFNDAVYYDDFLYTSLLLADANYFKSLWKSPFDPRETKQAKFFTGLYTGTVNMMHQIGNFNYTYDPLINANVLELPVADGRISFLVFLPVKGRPIKELFYNLRRTTLTSLFNMFKSEGPQVVSVQLPRFKTHTDVINLPELIYDMDIKRIFDPKLAELGNISDYNLHVSIMTQLAHIEVNEKGVYAKDTANFLVRNEDTIDFVANQTFAYIIVDRTTEFILYAGVYSTPSLF
ncbi:hypothetical protein K1T71_012722 [Dendrolimus kikuchii]|uniref:Uncharacterized protein n=1 Tax=Dendrolimus kikuchii TaxID=765133 RepID=A0ACC1CK49_9NEOP|nr:hypothetical protein K1T71_012722 [Dendrolimus kikuchii]